ncbi:hypothetical protein HK098_007879 [Nowakowskiella sp. JEL0407]|nr:hypothetical protein HK098_007879 [Nowakowskiella sp. JEL0407]
MEELIENEVYGNQIIAYESFAIAPAAESMMAEEIRIHPDLTVGEIQKLIVEYIKDFNARAHSEVKVLDRRPVEASGVHFLRDVDGLINDSPAPEENSENPPIVHTDPEDGPISRKDIDNDSTGSLAETSDENHCLDPELEEEILRNEREQLQKERWELQREREELERMKAQLETLRERIRIMDTSVESNAIARLRNLIAHDLRNVSQWIDIPSDRIPTEEIRLWARENGFSNVIVHGNGLANVADLPLEDFSDAMYDETEEYNGFERDNKQDL